AFSGCTSVRMSKLEVHNNVRTAGNALFSGMSNTQITSLSVPKHWDDVPGGWISGFTGQNYTVRGRSSMDLQSQITTTVHTRKIAQDLTGTSSSTGVIKNITRFKEYFTDEVYNSYPSDVEFDITSSSDIDALNQSLSITVNKYWDSQGRTKSNRNFSVRFTFDTSDLYVMNSSKTEIISLASGYATKPEWNDGNIIFPSTVTKIGIGAFSGITDLKTIQVAGTLNSIEKNAFLDCANFTGGFQGSNLNLSKVTSIGEDAFRGCSNLSSTFNLTTVTSLGAGAFANASSIKMSSLYFLDSLTIIPDSIFLNASSINNEIKLTNAKAIGSNAFNGAIKIWTKSEDGLLLEGVRSIGTDAFKGTYKSDSSDTNYISSIAVRGINSGDVKDLFTNHNLWSGGFWVEDDANVSNLDLLADGIDVGSSHTGVLVKGVMYTWGDNEHGQLGRGYIGSYSGTPSKVSKNPDVGFTNSGITQMEISGDTVIVLSKNVAYAWGKNYSGALGDGTNKSSGIATKIADNPKVGFTNSNITQVSTGGDVSAVLKGGVVYSFGYNSLGGLGVGNIEPSYIPVKPIASSGFENSSVTKVKASASKIFVIEGGVIYSWGHKYAGALGNNETGFNQYRSSAIKMLNNGSFSNSGITNIMAVGYCAATIKNGVMYTWGSNEWGQLGNGSGDLGEYRGLAAPVSNNSASGFTNSNISQMSIGRNHSAAIRNGVIYTWGINSDGELGIGTNQRSYLPIKTSDNPDSGFANSGINSVAAGDSFTAALKDGLLFSWGKNTRQQLGTTTPSHYSYLALRVDRLRSLYITPNNYESQTQNNNVCSNISNENQHTNKRQNRSKN
ncbi:MAG: leucine-rich repeat protein, partial [Mycoplasma sp.]